MGQNLLLGYRISKGVEVGGRQAWKKGRSLGPFSDVLEHQSWLLNLQEF